MFVSRQNTRNKFRGLRNGLLRGLFACSVYGYVFRGSSCRIFHATWVKGYFALLVSGLRFLLSLTWNFVIVNYCSVNANSRNKYFVVRGDFSEDTTHRALVKIWFFRGANLQNRYKYHSYVSPQFNGIFPQHGILLAYQNTKNCLTSGRTTGITLYVLRIIRTLQHFKDLQIIKSNLQFIDLIHLPKMPVCSWFFSWSSWKCFLQMSFDRIFHNSHSLHKPLHARDGFQIIFQW